MKEVLKECLVTLTSQAEKIRACLAKLEREEIEATLTSDQITQKNYAERYSKPEPPPAINMDNSFAIDDRDIAKKYFSIRQ